MSHPARFSPPIIDLVADILLKEWPGFMGRPIIHDHMAGTGERLHEMCNRDDMMWMYSGTELEPCFIVAPGIIEGDACDETTYPPNRFPNMEGQAGWILFTSWVYPNGMADNHLARDDSKRRNYRKAKAEITGNVEAKLHPNNAANFGYRGTKRPEEGGTSKRREEFWRIHREALANCDSAELFILNVSDFVYTRKGVKHVEPFVDDCRKLLAEYGWTDQVVHPVGTQRMGHGANRDNRVANEVVIVARRGA